MLVKYFQFFEHFEKLPKIESLEFQIKCTEVLCMNHETFVYSLQFIYLVSILFMALWLCHFMAQLWLSLVLALYIVAFYLGHFFLTFLLKLQQYDDGMPNYGKHS